MDRQQILNRIHKYGINDATLLMTFYNQVVIGRYENGELLFYKDRIIDFNLLTQARIFNEHGELRLVYSQEKKEFIESYITDNEDYFDENMYLIGNKIVDYDGKFTRLEQVKRVIEVPFEVTNAMLKYGLQIVVRNYFGIDSNNQVIIDNNRLVRIIEGGKE